MGDGNNVASFMVNDFSSNSDQVVQIQIFDTMIKYLVWLLLGFLPGIVFNQTFFQNNHFSISELGPRDLGSVYTCMSSNNNVSAPVFKRVTIDLLFPPTDVSITTTGQPLVAGTTYVLSCEVSIGFDKLWFLTCTWNFMLILFNPMFVWKQWWTKE